MQQMDPHIPPHFVVVVPGIMGSKLRDRRTGKLVWLDFDDFPLNPLAWDDWIERLFGQLAYPNDDLEPAGILDRLVIMPPFAKQEQYSRLVEALEGMGYVFDERVPEAERTGYTFAYDWRQDIRKSGRLLGDAIERWSALHGGAPAWIIGHSMGGIVARWYIEKEGGKDFVGRLFLMASPWNGAPKALSTIFNGIDMFMRGRFNPLKVRELTRRTIRTFPSAYQILPHSGPFLRRGDGEWFDPFAHGDWLADDRQRELLADARCFNDELGSALSVETLCFFGRKRPTVNEGIVVLDKASGLWAGITWEQGPLGDGSVMETSAVHERAQQKLPFVATHGNIYVHPGVLEVLQWELRDKYLAGAGAERPQPANTLATTAEAEQVFPGAPIRLKALLDGPLSDGALACLHREPTPESLAPEALEEVRDGRIHVQLAWQEGLPGNPPLPAVPDSVFGVLLPGDAPGEFVGEIRAPYAEGCYRLLSQVWLDGVRVTDSDLLVVDDGHPGFTIDPVTGKVIARGEAREV